MSSSIFSHHPNRREVISTMGAIAGTAALAPASGSSRRARRAPSSCGSSRPPTSTSTFSRTIIIATRPDDTVGLSKLATLIAAARAGAPNTLLFDNGDFLQGSPMGELVAVERGLKRGETHPVMAAMNMLGYDAATLGNHEFNYGLDFLDASIATAKFPICCANLVKGQLAASPRGDTTFLKPYLIIEREVTDEAGERHKLKIGVIGVVPPQIMQWDHGHLSGKVDTRDIVETVKAYLPEIREQNVDFVLALAHTGISTAPPGEKDENAAFHLSRLSGIDVMFTGHAHRLFPGAGYVSGEGVDFEKGTLNGVPSVMAGFWGSHLGQIDLVLQKDGQRLRVASCAVAALPIYKREGGKVSLPRRARSRFRHGACRRSRGDAALCAQTRRQDGDPSRILFLADRRQCADAAHLRRPNLVRQAAARRHAACGAAALVGGRALQGRRARRPCRLYRRGGRRRRLEERGRHLCLPQHLEGGENLGSPAPGLARTLGRHLQPIEARRATSRFSCGSTSRPIIST